jgi:hypothetical protein
MTREEHHQAKLSELEERLRFMTNDRDGVMLMNAELRKRLTVAEKMIKDWHTYGCYGEQLIDSAKNAGIIT